MGKNGYLERQKRLVDAYSQAQKETYIQFMTDTLILTLNDSDVMGKDVFGKERIKKVVDAWGRVYDQYHGALEKGDESDYWQIRLDGRLKRILGEEDFTPFGKRYEWLKDKT